MTIVKNLQQQQQTCQVPQVEIKQEAPKPPIKRRKSVEKPAPPAPPEIHAPSGKLFVVLKVLGVKLVFRTSPTTRAYFRRQSATTKWYLL